MKTSAFPLQDASSKARRLTLSPEPSRGGFPKAKKAREESNKRSSSSVADLEQQIQQTKRRWKTICPKAHEDLAEILARIRCPNSEDDLALALDRLEQILEQETPKRNGTTLALFYSGGHLDIIQKCLTKTNDSIVYLGAYRVLHLLCCRKDYFNVPEVLGISCLNTGLVYAGAMDAMLESLYHALSSSSFRNNQLSSVSEGQKSDAVKCVFEIVDTLVMGCTFETVVSLGVPRQALDLVKKMEHADDCAIVSMQVATLLDTFLSELPAAMERSSWDVDATLLKDSYHAMEEMAQKYKTSHTEISTVAFKVVDSMSEFLDDADISPVNKEN